MSKTFVSFLLCCIVIGLPINGQNNDERYRLQLHFSVPSGWMNDPNGLIYHNGFYHLFYQYNPVDTVWGPMHWGHAKSSDLIHWEDLPVALKPYERGTIFSGCCVVDRNNVTGFNADEPSLIAIYTLHNDQSQTQELAYSLDQDGVTWTHYDANPVIPNPGFSDFRDPNIFERDGMFYMVLAVGERIRFFSSIDLKQWQELSDFGVSPNEGDKSGVWECPALVTLKDEWGSEHDILLVSENGDERGSVFQYFVGKFDGETLRTYNQSRVLWAENGFDNYAAVPFHNDPHGRVVLVGWMSNWLYAEAIPTSGWRGQMTVPRELGLRTINGNIYLTQRPVSELYSLADTSRYWSSPTMALSGTQTIDLNEQIPFNPGSLLSLEYNIDINNATNGKVGLHFGNDRNEFVSFYYDIRERVYEFDRRNSGDVSFHPRFAETFTRANRIATENVVSARIILDIASIEIFADDGLNTFSAIFFPSELYENIQVITELPEAGTSVIVQRFTVSALNGIWSEPGPNSGSAVIPKTLTLATLTCFWMIFHLSSK